MAVAMSDCMSRADVLGAAAQLAVAAGMALGPGIEEDKAGADEAVAVVCRDDVVAASQVGLQGLAGVALPHSSDVRVEQVGPGGRPLLPCGCHHAGLLVLEDSEGRSVKARRVARVAAEPPVPWRGGNGSRRDGHGVNNACRSQAREIEPIDGDFACGEAEDKVQ